MSSSSIVAVIPAGVLALSALTYKLSWLDDAKSTALPSLLNTCMRATKKNRNPSLTTFPSLDDTLCARLAFFKEVTQSRAGFGAFCVFAAVVVPYLLRLSYVVSSPNYRSSPLPSLTLPLLASMLTSISTLLLGRGLGLFIPSIVTILYTVTALSKSRRSPGIAPLPAPAVAIYSANLTTFLSTILLVLQFTASSPREVKLHLNDSFLAPYLSKEVIMHIPVVTSLLSDFFPLVVALPLLFLGLRSVSRPQSEAAATEHMKTYLAEEIAYCFERTWSYYRQVGLISAAAHMYGVVRLFRGFFYDKAIFTSSTMLLLLLAATVGASLLSIVAIDHLTARRDAIDVECSTAIARAPAGNPGVEDSTWVLILLGLLCGPALPACLRFAVEEERNGWKGRRAWRMAVAKK